MSVFRPPILMLITDPTRRRTSLEEIVRIAVSSGISAIQFRDKESSWSEKLKQATVLRGFIPKSVLFLINQDIELACKSDADGIHLPEFEGDVSGIRERFGRPILIGRSVHSLEMALLAEKQGVDYIQVGTIFPTASKPGHRGAGLSLLKEIRKNVSIPMLAVGGIGADNAQSVLETGVDGISIISAITESSEPARSIQTFLDLLGITNV